MNEAKLTRNQLILALVLMAAALVPVWTPKYFPSQNGPEYLLLTHMVKEWNNPEFDYSDNYRLVFVPVPNLTTQIATYCLGHIAPIDAAWRLTLSLTMILFAAGVFYFLKHFSPRNYLMGFLAFPFLLNYYLLKGYDNFYASLAFFLFFFGYLAKTRDSLRWRDVGVLMTLLLLTYFSHMYSFLVACVLAPIYLAMAKEPLSRLAKISVVFLPAAILFVQYFVFARSLTAEMVHEGDAWIIFPTLAAKASYFLQTLMYSVWKPAAYIFLALVGLPIWLLWALRLKGAISDIASSKDTLRERLARNSDIVLSLVVIVGYFLAPYEVAGWPKFYERLLPFVLVFAAAGAVAVRTPWFPRIAMTLSAVASIAIAVGMTITVHRTSDDVAEYVSGIPYVKKNGRMLSLYCEDVQVGRIRPLRWTFNYYNIERGGVTGESVVKYPGRVPVRYRYDRKKELPTFNVKRDSVDRLEQIANLYDNIIVWGDIAELRVAIEQAGFQRDFQQGRLSIYSKSIAP